MRALIIDLVLATDLAAHFEHVDRVRELAAARGAAAAGASSGASTWTSPLATDEVDVPTLLSIAIKFADHGLGQSGTDHHFVGTFVLAHAGIEPVAQFLAGRPSVGVERDIGHRRFAAIGIGPSDHERFLDRRMVDWAVNGRLMALSWLLLSQF